MLVGAAVVLLVAPLLRLRSAWAGTLAAVVISLGLYAADRCYPAKRPAGQSQQRSPGQLVWYAN